MDRVMVYPGQIPLETHILQAQKNSMMAVAKLAQAVLGSRSVVRGLPCSATAPASMQVSIGAGEIYMLKNVDSTAYSSIPADTTHQILKQGMVLDSQLLSCPAPGTVGQSINYLIQATYTTTDEASAVLPYYNASNPSQAWSGPAGAGTSQPTSRDGICTVAVKAGAAAATGSQTTPAPDSGYVGLWVVTVANGQTSITSANISQYPGAPFIGAMQMNNVTAITAANSPVASPMTLKMANSGLITVDATAGNVAVNMDTTANIMAPLMFLFNRIDTSANTVTINFTGGDTLDGVSSININKHMAVMGDTVSKWYHILQDVATDAECITGTDTQKITPPHGLTAAIAAAEAAHVGGRLRNTTIISTAGANTYTPPAWLKFADVWAVGAGGGGGGCTGGTGTWSEGGGGGGGEGAFGRFTAAQIGASQTVTIGAHGTGGTSGNHAGTAGGTTSFGSLLTAAGGLGGSGMGASSGAATAAGGAGGTGGAGGNLHIAGEAGRNGRVISSTGSILSQSSGGRAAGPYGGFGGAAPPATGGGLSGAGPGAGGSGAATVAASSYAGGDGADGIAVIFEYE